MAAFLAPFLAAFFVAIAILPFRFNIESCNACVAISHLYMCIQISCQVKKRGESLSTTLDDFFTDFELVTFTSDFRHFVTTSSRYKKTFTPFKKCGTIIAAVSCNACVISPGRKLRRKCASSPNSIPYTAIMIMRRQPS